MALFNKKNLDNKHNKYGITQYDMKDSLNEFPVGVVVRMMEEQELQGNKPNITIFQNFIGAGRHSSGFDWNKTEAGYEFWAEVISGNKNFDVFFERYPEYEKYN